MIFKLLCFVLVTTYNALYWKGLELKMTKSHFIKFEFSPTMHFALNFLQPVLYIFRQKTA